MKNSPDGTVPTYPEVALPILRRIDAPKLKPVRIVPIHSPCDDNTLSINILTAPDGEIARRMVMRHRLGVDD